MEIIIMSMVVREISSWFVLLLLLLVTAGGEEGGSAWGWSPAVVGTPTTRLASASAGESLLFPYRETPLFLSNDQQPSSDSSTATTTSTTDIDVSDIGVIETSGYESTSRIPSVYDDACFWTETPTDVSVLLALPGLRGQPPMALSVLTSRNTISVAVFGRIVWSAILRGETLPETATFETREGVDFVPVIEYTVQKADDANSQRRWDGFILQVGEDSLL